MIYNDGTIAPATRANLAKHGHYTAWVCTDCYIAHHYGYHEREGQWFTGDSDEPSDREPLCKLNGFDLADNTCSNHNGDDEQGCSECGHEGWEDGITDFSSHSCGGCGSALGGSRYRLALFTISS